MQIIVNGQLITYTSQGVGEVIVLLHGWGAQLGTFDALARQLAQKYRVVRLDLPGFGGSPLPPHSWSLAQYAHIVTDMLKKIQVTKVYAIIGHSFGGRVAIKMAAHSQQPIAKVILIGSGGIKRSHSLRNVTYKVIAKAGKWVVKALGLYMFCSPLRRRLYKAAGATDYLGAAGLKHVFLRVINEDLRGQAAHMPQPTLIIWGQQDSQTPLSDASILHAHIKNSRLVVIPHAGHFTYLDQPAVVAREIEAFL